MLVLSVTCDADLQSERLLICDHGGRDGLEKRHGWQMEIS